MQIAVNIILSASLILLVSFLYEILFSVTKFFNLAHASVIVSCPYFVLFFSRSLNLPFFLAIILAISLAVFLSLLFEVFIYRTMRKRNVASLNYLIVSIAIFLIVQNCISLYFGDNSQKIYNEETKVGNRILGAYVTNLQIISTAIYLSLFAISTWILKRTQLGKSIRAVSNNAELSAIYGINSDKVILYTFCIASVLASIAGILSSMETYLTPGIGFNLLIYGVAAMMIAGLGNTKNLIAGALLVAAVRNLSAYYLDTQWMDAATYLLLIAFLVWKPLGLSGRKLKKVEV